MKFIGTLNVIIGRYLSPNLAVFVLESYKGNIHAIKEDQLPPDMRVVSLFDQLRLWVHPRPEQRVFRHTCAQKWDGHPR